MLARLHRTGGGMALLASALVGLGCEMKEEEPPAPPADLKVRVRRVNVRDLVDLVLSPEERAHAAGVRQLMGLAQEGFAPRDGVRLLRAAARPAPKGREDAAATLVRAAAVRPGPDDVAVVEELFPRYSPEARRAALELLARLPGRAAAEALMRLVRAHAGAGGLPAMPVGTLADRPRHADVFFPALLEHLGRPELRAGIGRIAGAFAAAGLLTEPMLRPYADRLCDVAEAQLDALAAGEPEPGSHVAQLLDLLAYVPTPRAEVLLRRALALDAPEVEAHALVAMVRQGRPVDPNAVGIVASRPEVRRWLWERLRDLHQLDLLPAQFRTQAALAESELVGWLSESEDLGRPPDQIEAMGSVTGRFGPAGIRRYYLFRFRVEAPADLAERGWMAGWVSYPPGGESTIGGQAGSQFVSWDDRTPQGHIVESQDMRGEDPGDDQDE